jgi:WD40 repeat protein
LALLFTLPLTIQAARPPSGFSPSPKPVIPAAADSTAPGPAPAQRTGDPATAPILRLEMGMHQAEIMEISVDAAGRTLLTASADKTARLWDLATGKVLHTLRPPLDEGLEGGLSACALSPDGQVAALAGHTAYQWDQACSIYFFDAATGQFLRRIPGLPARSVRYLAFSRDGLRLAACLQGRPGLGGARTGGVVVFRLEDGQELFRALDYGDTSYGADFDPAGRLATSSRDGQIRLYDPQGRLMAKVGSPGGVRPRGIRFSPDGTTLAAGHDDRNEVYLFAMPALRPLYAAETSRNTPGYLATVAWSPDGNTLYAGGRLVHGKNGSANTNAHNTVYVAEGTKSYLYDLNKLPTIRRWSKGGRGSFEDIRVETREDIFDLVMLPSGIPLWCSGEPAWGQLDGAIHRGTRADFRDMDLKLDPTGARLAFCYDFKGSAFSFDLPGRRLIRGEHHGLNATRITGLPLLWDRTSAPKLGVQTLGLDQNEFSGSLAIAADTSCFLMGTNLSLRCYDAQGRPLWARPAPETVCAVNLSEDKTLAVAAYGDGTIRWHRCSDGQELLAFFPHPDRRRWVLWTPSGYYDCSPGAEDLLGWHLNRGKDDAADFFPVSRFRGAYYRPDVIDRVLQARDEGKALKLANEARVQQFSDEAKAMEAAIEARARKLADEAKALRLAGEAKARKLAEEAVARRLTEEAKARKLADQAKAARLANEAKARKLAEEAKALELAIAAKDREEAETAKALRLANEVRAERLAEQARARQLAAEARARQLVEEAKALQLAKEASIEQMLPPVAAIVSPADGETIATQTLAVKVRVHHPKNRPIDEVWATVDGRALSSRGIQVKETLAGAELGRVVTLEVPVPARDCIVSVLARSGQAVSVASSVSLKWGATPRTVKGSLNVLAVGVSRYRNEALNLEFAAKDARDLAGRMEGQKAHLYASVQSRVLVDADASKGAIQDGLEWLARSTTERDTAVVFLAGHGLNDALGQFFFLPQDADLEQIQDSMVSGGDIQKSLAAIPGRVVVFLDSCHSGAVMNRNSSVTRFVNELGSAENGVVVFTASTGAQLSQESPEWNNGAFTKALDEGLDGEADLFKKGRVTVSSLDAFLGDRVPTLTNGQQTPTVIKPTSVPDFPVALIK